MRLLIISIVTSRGSIWVGKTGVSVGKMNIGVVVGKGVSVGGGVAVSAGSRYPKGVLAQPIRTNNRAKEKNKRINFFPAETIKVPPPTHDVMGWIGPL